MGCAEALPPAGVLTLTEASGSPAAFAILAPAYAGVPALIGTTFTSDEVPS
jgi:hypothetical protein